MATKEKPAATRKPAARKPAAVKPAASKPATRGRKPAAGISAKEFAARLEMTPKALRARIRKLNGGAVVGKGKRYTFTDADVKRITAQINKG